MVGKTDFMVLVGELKNAVAADDVDYSQVMAVAKELARMMSEENVELRSIDKVDLIKQMSRLRVKAKSESPPDDQKVDELAALSGEMLSLM